MLYVIKIHIEVLQSYHGFYYANKKSIRIKKHIVLVSKKHQSIGIKKPQKVMVSKNKVSVSKNTKYCYQTHKVLISKNTKYRSQNTKK